MTDHISNNASETDQLPWLLRPLSQRSQTIYRNSCVAILCAAVGIFGVGIVRSAHHTSSRHKGNIVKDDLADIQTLSTAISDVDLNVAQRENISNSLYEFCNRPDHEPICRQVAGNAPITYTSKDLLGYAAKVTQSAVAQDDRLPEKASWDAARSIDLLSGALRAACGSEAKTRAKLEQAGL